MHDLLFENSAHLSIAKIEELAAGLGLDMNRFRYDVKSRFVGQWLNNDRLAGVEAGVTGTPAVYVNGRKAKDRSFDGLNEMIKKELVRLGKGARE